MSMEKLSYVFKGRQPSAPFDPILVGVVGSGNLEVMLETGAAETDCVVHISTSARGFGAIWEAVLKDFHARHALRGVAISINDMGATPAVVSLRLDQAVAALQSSERKTT
jgi:malonate decarboxylase delta subunit